MAQPGPQPKAPTPTPMSVPQLKTRTRPSLLVIIIVAVVALCGLGALASSLSGGPKTATPTAGSGAIVDATDTALPAATDTAQPTKTGFVIVDPTDTFVPPSATPTLDTLPATVTAQTVERSATRTAVVDIIGKAYDPFGRDLDCSDFISQAEAQVVMEASGKDDPFGLDGNPKDGKACESLP